MPRATANINETVRKELKTLPAEGDIEGGFVVLRRLTYGEKLDRRAMISGMKIETEKGKKEFQGEMQLVSEAATLFDFARCIIDHNLEDEDGRKLDLGKKADVKALDPRVGEEIDNLLGDLNNFEDDQGE